MRARSSKMYFAATPVWYAVPQATNVDPVDTAYFLIRHPQLFDDDIIILNAGFIVSLIISADHRFPSA